MKILAHALCLALLGCGGSDPAEPVFPEAEQRAMTMAHSVCGGHGGLMTTWGHPEGAADMLALDFVCMDGTAGRAPLPYRVP